jgi:hypothetical protein
VSWTAVRPYFDTILESAGFAEWADGFATDNIPANILDRAYHVQIGPITGTGQNQSTQETEATVTIRMFFKGFVDSQLAVDTAIEMSETVMKDCVNPATRTTTAGIKNVIFNETNIDPIDASNDNAVVVTSSFTVRVIFGF